MNHERVKCGYVAHESGHQEWLCWQDRQQFGRQTDEVWISFGGGGWYRLQGDFTSLLFFNKGSRLNYKITLTSVSAWMCLSRLTVFEHFNQSLLNLVLISGVLHKLLPSVTKRHCSLPNCIVLFSSLRTYTKVSCCLNKPGYPQAARGSRATICLHLHLQCTHTPLLMSYIYSHANANRR
jgi:hypothetical protein